MYALYINNGKLTFRKNAEPPTLFRNEVLIKVRLAGICSTDLELVKGYSNFQGIPGHEFVGEVVKVKNVLYKHLIGKRVVGNINLGCGKCEYCIKGIAEHCLSGKALGIIKKDGVFAEFVSLPVSNLFEIPDNISDRQAVFVEPLAAALRIPEVLLIPFKKRVGVLGAGRLGMLISQVLSISGARPVVIGRNLNSLILPKKLSLETNIIDKTEDKSFDFIVDATGSQEGFKHALRLIKPLGTIVVKSTYKGNLDLNFSKVVVDEITIVGSRCGPFASAIDLLSKNLIKTEDLIDAEYPLSKGVVAFEHATKRGVKKVLLKP